MSGTKWHNADGLEVKFADYAKTAANFVNRPRAVEKDGYTQQFVISVDLTKIANATITYTSDLDNDGTNDGFNTGDFYLPAYSSVIKATILVTEAAAGGTSIKLGTFGLTGSAVDDDFIVTATEGVLANLDTKGARVYGNGVGVATTAETVSVGSADAYLGITGAGTWTAGKLLIVVDYISPIVDS